LVVEIDKIAATVANLNEEKLGRKKILKSSPNMKCWASSAQAPYFPTKNSVSHVTWPPWSSSRSLRHNQGQSASGTPALPTEATGLATGPLERVGILAASPL